MPILVSISVITYNSSLYVLDTLESIRNQTYPALELVISDDCSTDNTVELCQKWIDQHRNRFVNIKTVVSQKNRGISANYNQGMDNCTGEYIKEIAGDDMLLPNCIEDYVNFVEENPSAFFCFGRAKIEGNSEEKINFFKEAFDYSFFQMPLEKQYEQLAVFSNPIPSSVFFYSKKRMFELGIRNDERIPFMEDWPKWINILKRGEKLWFLDKEVSRYRISDQQLSTSGSKRWSRQMYLLYLYYKFLPTWKYDKKLALKRLIRGAFLYL